MASSYIKGINGLRAIAALVLLWGHTPQGSFAQWEISSIPLPAGCAYVFFVISGFLAGYRYDGNISSIDYYKKKARRILPLYYSYILITIIIYCIWGWKDEIIDNRLWYYVFLVPNIPFCHASGLLPLVHLWFIGSLLLFYLIFPLFAKIAKDRMAPLSAICCIGWFLLKIAIYFFIGKDTFLYRYWGVLAFDCSFGGVYLGLMLKRNSDLYSRLFSSSFSSIVRPAVWLLFLTSGLYGNFIPAPIRVEYIAFLSGVLIIDQLSNKPILNLENKIFNWLGKVSYEIYVTQILIIILLSTLYVRHSLSLPDALVYSLVTFFVLLISWLYHWLLSYHRDCRLMFSI